jgi:hypothetical protein
MSIPWLSPDHRASPLRREALSSPETMSILGRDILRIATLVVNQQTGTSNFLCEKPLKLRGRTTWRSHPNLLPLLSNEDTTSSSPESTRGSQAPRYTQISGCFYEIWGTRARGQSNLTKDGGTTA